MLLMFDMFTIVYSCSTFVFGANDVFADMLTFVSLFLQARFGRSSGTTAAASAKCQPFRGGDGRTNGWPYI